MSNNVPPGQPQSWPGYPPQPPQPGYPPQDYSSQGYPPPQGYHPHGHPPPQGYPPLPSSHTPQSWQPGRTNLPAPPYGAPGRVVPEGNKSFVVTFVLSVFLGVFGADRFYLGKPGSALLKLITFGGFGYWWLIDVIVTLTGHQRDSSGLKLEGYEKYKKTVWKVIGGYFGVVIAFSIFVQLVFTPDGSGLTIFGWTLFGGLAIAGAIAGVVWFTRYRGQDDEVLEETDERDPIPPRVRAELDKLRELRPLYLAQEPMGSPSAAAVAKEIEALVKNVPELFQRLKNKADKEQLGFARAEYTDKLARLTAALDRDYMLDLIINPHLWSNPEEQVRKVQSALEAVSEQVLDNIRSVNALRSLVFQVSLDGLDGIEGLDGFEHPRRELP